LVREKKLVEKTKKDADEFEKQLRGYINELREKSD